MYKLGLYVYEFDSTELRRPNAPYEP
ncbi:hypothetical protein F383_37233 [Gossypium arboreum]|uniref:Uncharacterized protein n=1 Tax=Gossypium arboreum TaxID=29729 RepID=A0A0B0MGA5_GOSAR|nr:hypothetical protein F383_37233 [Gossypium arboreum]